MIKNIVFDIGNVILRFDIDDVLSRFTDDELDRKFILDNIINSPEWLKNSLIDTGYVSRDDAISIVKDRTNHVKDDLIEKFWTTYNDFAEVDLRLLNIIGELRHDGYKVYLLSNINPYTYDFVNKSGLFDLVDGYVLSYKEHMIKPYDSIYLNLVNRYSINPGESLFIDDNQNNIDTGNKLGFVSKKVNSDDYDDVVRILKELNLFDKM